MADDRDGPILITGATGLLGSWLRRTAPPGREVVALTHQRPLADGTQTVTADLRDPASAERAVAQATPALVLHAAYAHDGPSIVDATRNVAEAAAAAGAELVFISTDAVFSGDGRRRTEDQAPDPVWSYGRWKAAAEALVTAGPAPSAIVRLPLLVSLEPEDHVTARIHRGLAEGEASPWFHDELRQPAYAAEVAGALWQLVALDPADRSGCWHLPGPELLSRFEIAVRTAHALALGPTAIRPQATPDDAGRPRSLVLGDDRARRALGWSPSRVFARDLGAA